jgi:hypothetical protein
MTTRNTALAMSISTMCANSSPAQSSVGDLSHEAAGHLHVVNKFRFEVAASMQRVAPLFAPEAERSWEGKDRNPVFLYPQPSRDVPSAVWTVKHGPLINSVWVNTLLDVPGGRMQYVAIIGDHLAQTVDVHVTALGRSRTARAGRSGSAALRLRWD